MVRCASNNQSHEIKGNIKNCSKEKQQHMGGKMKHSMFQKLREAHGGWQRNKQGLAMPSLRWRQSIKSLHLDPSQWPKLAPMELLVTARVSCSLGHVHIVISYLWTLTHMAVHPSVPPP